MIILWSLSYNSFVKFHGKKIWKQQDDHIIFKSMLDKVHSIKGLYCDFTFSDHEVGSPTIGQQNRHKITATLGLVVHAAG